MGLAIQQGVIQHPVQQGSQPRVTGTQPGDAVNTNPVHSLRMQQTRVPVNQGYNEGNTMSDPEGRDRLPEHEHDPVDNGYVMNCIHESRPFSLNDIARPVFVNNYYTGEPLILVTRKKLIRLDECDISTEVSTTNLESEEYTRDSLRMPMTMGKNI